MRIAQIGIDDSCQDTARALRQLDVLSAICDTDPQKSRGYGQRYCASHYDSLDNLFGSEEFDGAFVEGSYACFDTVKRLLEAKKHVFVRDPHVYGSKDMEELANAAKKGKAVLTCRYSQRLNPAAASARDIVAEGRCGDLIQLESHNRGKAPSGEQAIYHGLIPAIDAANWFFGAMPHVVFARGGKIRREHDDFAGVMLGYEGGRMAYVSSSRIAPKRIERLDAVCSDGTVSSDLVTGKVTIQGVEDPGPIPGMPREPLLEEIRGFVDAVRGKPVHADSMRQAASAIRVSEAALLSSQKGIPIYLDLK